MATDLRHLLVAGFTDEQDFKSTLSVRRQPAPQRNRGPHGARLLQELAQIRAEAEALRGRRIERGIDPDAGTAISLQISPPGVLDPSKLEWRRDGIEVLNSIRSEHFEVLTLFVPEGKLSAFERRVEQYLTRDVAPRTPGGQPKPANANLVNAIHSFRRAAFEQLWTDPVVAAPPPGEAWFQLWLRVGVLDGPETYEAFVQSAGAFELQVAPGYVTFPGRIVVAVQATRAVLESALDLLDVVAEIRMVHPTAEFFLEELKPFEQAEWIADLAERLEVPPADTDAPTVALLDTGVNNAHPLIAPLLENADRHSANPAWGVDDHEGHGTEMAGLSLIGDLVGPLESDEPVRVPHRLESVKILPPQGNTPPRLYGAVTAAAVSAVETGAPERRRVFAMMTTELGDTTGLPSEWSASLDRLACGLPLDSEGEALGPKRLLIAAAGNIPWPQWDQPNDLHPVESPGQAWNVLSVGACTDLTHVDHATYPAFQPIRSAGQQSASSRTSVLWARSAWPFKPDVVAEGGNGCFDTNFNNAVVRGPDSLRLLTTGNQLTHPLVESGDTSAAAAEVARICGNLTARYPEYWPETIRALVISGASITPAMRAGLPVNPSKAQKERLLRSVGYGRVDLNASMNSTTRRASLVLQEELVPYVKEGNSVKMGQMHLHKLPWPTEQLQAIAEAEVVLRVTLSYFIEPNPSRRGWQSKFRYQSHGLRFAVKGAVETDAQFLQRVNKLERDIAEDPAAVESMPDPDGASWAWGSQLRSRGSIHHDEWQGSAADLALKSHIAVFPVGGWWKDWTESEKYSNAVRYALVATLEVKADVDIDIYTPIAAEIGVQVPT